MNHARPLATAHRLGLGWASMTHRRHAPEDPMKLEASAPAKGDSSGRERRAAASSALLPTDLEASLEILDDAEFDRLLAGVIHEASRRHKPFQAHPDPKAPAASVK